MKKGTGFIKVLLFIPFLLQIACSEQKKEEVNKAQERTYEEIAKNLDEINRDVNWMLKSARKLNEYTSLLLKTQKSVRVCWELNRLSAKGSVACVKEFSDSLKIIRFKLVEWSEYNSQKSAILIEAIDVLQTKTSVFIENPNKQSETEWVKSFNNFIDLQTKLLM